MNVVLMIGVTTGSNFPNSCVMVGMLTSMWDPVITDIVATPLRIQLKIVQLTELVCISLDTVKIDSDIDMIAEMFIIVAIIAIIGLDMVIPKAHAADVWVINVMLNVLEPRFIDTVLGMRVDMFTGVDSSMWTSNITA